MPSKSACFYFRTVPIRIRPQIASHRLRKGSGHLGKPRLQSELLNSTEADDIHRHRSSWTIAQDRSRKAPTTDYCFAENKRLLSPRRCRATSFYGLDYLAASKRLPTRRIGGRVLIPLVDLRKYAGMPVPSA